MKRENKTKKTDEQLSPEMVIKISEIRPKRRICREYTSQVRIYLVKFKVKVTGAQKVEKFFIPTM